MCLIGFPGSDVGISFFTTLFFSELEKKEKKVCKKFGGVEKKFLPLRHQSQTQNTMKEIKLTIESSKFEKDIRKQYEHFLDNARMGFNVDDVLRSMSYLQVCLPIKCGRGGSHVWISDLNNNRIAIIELK